MYVGCLSLALSPPYLPPCPALTPGSPQLPAPIPAPTPVLPSPVLPSPRLPLSGMVQGGCTAVAVLTDSLIAATGGDGVLQVRARGKGGRELLVCCSTVWAGM